MRRPYRERLRIILNELGAGVGGRAEDVNATVRRASPALRETDKVLKILARQNQVLKDLTTNADTVIGDLADNRRNVGRFVKETEDAATTSAERRVELQRGPPAAADVPARAAADDVRARGDRGRLDAVPARPQRLRRPARALPREPRPVRGVQPRQRPHARRDGRRRPAGGPLRAADRRRAHQDDREGARARQQPRDRAARPRRPRPRRREGQALAGRPGLHRLRGGPLLHLRPDDGHQRLRRERPHPQDQPVRVGVQRLPERRLAPAQGEGEPRLPEALPRRARPQPAGRHDRRPDRHRRRRSGPRAPGPEPQVAPKKKGKRRAARKRAAEEREHARAARPQEGARAPPRRRRWHQQAGARGPERDAAAVPQVPKVPGVPNVNVNPAAAAGSPPIRRPSSTTS